MNNRILLGLLFIFVGLVAFVSQFFNIEFWDTIFSLLPMVLMVSALIWMYTKSVNLTNGIILFCLGAVWQMDNLHLLNFWSVFFPMILIGIGVYVVLGKKLPKRNVDSISDSNVDTISEIAIFGGMERTLSSQNFRGGTITAIFGGVELDLRQAKVAPNAHLEVTALFGGVELFIPAGVRVETSGIPIFGGCSDKSQSQGFQPDSPVLTIRSIAVFGGVEIHN